jgi:hypothetical protein
LVQFFGTVLQGIPFSPAEGTGSRMFDGFQFDLHGCDGGW